MSQKESVLASNDVSCSIDHSLCLFHFRASFRRARVNTFSHIRFCCLQKMQTRKPGTTTKYVQFGTTNCYGRCELESKNRRKQLVFLPTDRKCHVSFLFVICCLVLSCLWFSKHVVGNVNKLIYTCVRTNWLLPVLILEKSDSKWMPQSQFGITNPSGSH